MAVLLEQKCPNCGGSVSYSAETQNMTCPACGAEFDVEALQKVAEQRKEDIQHVIEWQSDGAPWREEETKNLAVYMCSSCGGKIITDVTTGATSCPYCENSVVVKSHFSGEFKPDKIIPFKVTREEAISALKRHANSNKYIPAPFKDENRINEIQGVYVPHWLFSGDGTASALFSARNIRTWRRGDYDYSEINHYSIHRQGRFEFSYIPVDGSQKMDNTLMEAIEPFDYSEFEEFSTGYLMGFLADKYDVSPQECVERANQRIEDSIETALRNTVVGYQQITKDQSNINLKNGRYDYALLPVWMLTTTWNGERYIFAMNGQTGKFIGNLPLDKKKFYKHLAGITAGLSGITYLIIYFVSHFLAGGGII